MALSRPEAMAYLGIKHHLTFRAWCEATGMFGSPKNPTKKQSPRTWTVEELELGRKIAQEVQQPPTPTNYPVTVSTESPKELLDRLFPRTRAKKKP